MTPHRVRLHSERLPALNQSDDAPEVLLIHGWGMSSAVFRRWLPQLRLRANVTLLDLPGCGHSPKQPDVSVEALVDQIAAIIPERAVIVGWSLGGQLATLLAARHPQRCAALFLLASNPKFIAEGDWPGLPADTFAAFETELERDPAALHRRFLGLQVHGDRNARPLLKWLRDSAALPDLTALRQGLRWLAELDTRSTLAELTLPAVHLLGAADALVPAALAQQASIRLPKQYLIELDGIGHLPFASAPEICWHHLQAIINASGLLPRLRPPARAKRDVAAAFGRAAASYDSAAELQRCVADQLAKLVAVEPVDRLLDIGCGTGRESAALAQRCNVVALDLSPAMLAHAAAHHRQPLWLAGDAENLPLADCSVDAIFSSLALQWCEHPGAAFAEMRRVLRPGGCAWIATLGPQTLHELRAAWAAVDDSSHVNTFTEREQLERLITRAGLRVEAWQAQPMVLRYAELRQLTRELKAIGASNVNRGRPTGLAGRQRLGKFASAYEALRGDDGLLPATYEVWFLTLQRPLELYDE